MSITFLYMEYICTCSGTFPFLGSRMVGWPCFVVTPGCHWFHSKIISLSPGAIAEVYTFAEVIHVTTVVYHLVKVHVCSPRARFFLCPRQVQNCCLDRRGHPKCCCWQSELLLCPGLLPSSRGVTKMACGQISAAPSSLNKDANL